MSCVICDIVATREKSHVIYDSEDFICFLDNHPLFIGHSLLAPKQHIQTFYELSENNYDKCFLLLKNIGLAIEKSIKSEGSFIAINNKVSQSIPHLHIHIVPRNKKDGLRGFFWPRMRYRDDDHMRETQKIITKYLTIIISSRN